MTITTFGCMLSPPSLGGRRVRDLLEREVVEPDEWADGQTRQHDAYRGRARRRGGQHVLRAVVRSRQKLERVVRQDPSVGVAELDPVAAARVRLVGADE